MLAASSSSKSICRLCLRNSLLAIRTFSRSSLIRSHIGTQPIAIPAGVECEISQIPTRALNSQNAQQLSVSGPLGSRQLQIPTGIRADVSEDKLSSTPGRKLSLQAASKDADIAASWGLTWAQANNAVRGVSTGFQVTIRLVGVGYRAAIELVEQPASTSKQQVLVMRLGYPRPVRVPMPDGITCEIPSTTDITLKGVDRDKLGNLAAAIRRYRPPEPYNGKGIFVNDEKIKRKEVRKK